MVGKVMPVSKASKAAEGGSGGSGSRRRRYLGRQMAGNQKDMAGAQKIQREPKRYGGKQPQQEREYYDIAGSNLHVAEDMAGTLDLNSDFLAGSPTLRHSSLRICVLLLERASLDRNRDDDNQTIIIHRRIRINPCINP